MSDRHFRLDGRRLVQRCCAGYQDFLGLEFREESLDRVVEMHARVLV